MFAALLSSCTGADSSRPDTVPTAIIDVPGESSHVLSTLAFDGSRSFDPDGRIAHFMWDFGNGSHAVGEKVTHSFTELGRFEVTLTVVDDQGLSASTSVSIRTFEQSAGYYTGTAISEVTGESTPIEVIIGANNVIHAFDYQHLRTSYWGSVSASNGQVTGDLSAELRDQAFVFPDGSTVGNVNIEATIKPGKLISGSFTGAADSGIVDVHYMGRLAERPSSLSDISGAWQWSESTGFSASVLIDERGRFDYSDTKGCLGRGRLEVIDPSLNGFEFRARWDCADTEDPRWNGEGEGIVFVDDYYSPGVHRLVFAESTWNGSSSVWTVERAANGNATQTAFDPLVALNEITPVRAGRQYADQ